MANLRVHIKVDDLRRWIENLVGDMFTVDYKVIIGTDGKPETIEQITVEVVDKTFEKVLKHLKIPSKYSFEATNRGDGYYEMGYDDSCRVLAELRLWAVKVRRYYEKYLRRLADFLDKVDEVDWGADYEP